MIAVTPAPEGERLPSGGGGYYGYNRDGGSGLGGVPGLVLIVLLVVWLVGGVQFTHP